MMLRPELPSVPSAGRANAATLNQSSISSSLGRPLIELRVADEVGAIVGEAVEVAVGAGGDRQRRAGLQA